MKVKNQEFAACVVAKYKRSDAAARQALEWLRQPTCKFTPLSAIQAANELEDGMSAMSWARLHGSLLKRSGFAAPNERVAKALAAIGGIVDAKALVQKAWVAGLNPDVAARKRQINERLRKEDAWRK